MISGGGESLILSGDKTFTVLKDGSGKKYTMMFDMRCYLSYQGGGFNYYGSYSGAYIFRPSDYQQESVSYSNMTRARTYNAAGFVQEMFIDYDSDSRNRSAAATIAIRYYDESPAAEWNVYLGEIT